MGGRSSIVDASVRAVYLIETSNKYRNLGETNLMFDECSRKEIHRLDRFECYRLYVEGARQLLTAGVYFDHLHDKSVRSIS